MLFLIYTHHFFIPLCCNPLFAYICEMFDRGQKYVFLGSCFAQHIGGKMGSEGYDVVCNPLGTLFNPESIRLTVRQSLYGNEATLPMFMDSAMQEWRCWWANTRFRADSELAARMMVQDSYNGLGQDLRQAGRVFLTLGTNVCYRLVNDGLVVSNCQRQPDTLFEEETLSFDEVCRSLKDTLDCLLGANPTLRITFTVSPYRYRKYGWHRSQLSKAVLLLSIDKIVGLYGEQVDYFPSYEIMMDELRDYSYYAPDGLHPSEGAVDIIWKRLCESQP